MRSLVFCCLLSLAPEALAKDPCKQVKEHTDAFGATTRGRQFLVGPVSLGIVASPEGTFLHTSWSRRGVVDTDLPAGHPTQVALADGTILDLESTSISPAVSKVADTIVLTHWSVALPLDETQLRSLSQSTIRGLRTELAGQSASVEIPEKGASKVQNVALCLATTTES